MKNKFYLQKTLFIMAIMICGTNAFAQFSGLFAPANWSFNTTTTGGDGSVNTVGAPASIILNGSDNYAGGCCSQYEQYSITIPINCKISFDYSHSNFDVDNAQYVINGTVTQITSNGSGTISNVIVNAGDVFSFRVFNQDNCCGRGVLTISNFSVSTASALNFDGANDYVQMADPNFGTSNFTIETWMKPNTTTGAYLITTRSVEMGGAGNWFVIHYNNNGGIGLELADAGIGSAYFATANNVIAVGAWNHVALVRSGLQFSIYVNGILEASYTDTGLRSFITGNNSMRLSGWANVGVAFFNGNMDETRFWNVARTACEINTYKNCEITTTAAGLIGNYHFNQGYDASNNITTNTLTDVSGSARTGTLTNFALNGSTSNWISPGAIANDFATPLTLPTSIVTTTNVACNGGSNGSIAATTTGGTPSYTYLWSNGAITSSITTLIPGVYTRTVTDANSCSSISTGTITQPSALVTSTAVTNVSCNGGANGVAAITASGGTAGYSYLWSNGAVTSTATGLVAGVYTATVTDANSCTSTKNVTITQPSALVTSTAVTNIACNGGSNGVAAITASGGTSAYTYVWSNGATTSTATGLVAGVYTATVTDANSCKSIKNATITQPSALTTTSAVTNVLCNGGSGSATVTATGGTGAYTYLASNGATVSAQSGLMAGTYNYTVTDANACTKTQALTITQPSALTTTSAVTNVLCNGGSGSATVTATGGTGAYTYLASNGATVSTQSGLMAGTYNYTVTDANACEQTQILSITEPTAINLSASANNATICAGASSTLTANATGGTGTLTYTWVSGPTTNVNTVAPAATAVYTVDVTDANNCAATSTVEVTVNALPTISVNSGSICAGQSFTMVPTGAVTYTYSNGTDVVMPTADASYSVSGTDANGCASNVDAISSVTVNALPTISVNSGSICAGQSFTMVPTGAVTYTYSNGTDVVTPTADATYSVSGTDANGCISNVDAVSSVTVNALPTISAITNNTLLCVGQTATLSVTGALTYTWSTTENTTDIAVTPTVQTTYTVEGTDVNGCANTTMITQNVNDCTGIETLSNDISVKVYPNPNNGLFFMELLSTSKVTVTNALGQVVIAETFEAGKHTVDIHNEATGVYFVKVLENNKQQIIKLIKE